MKTPKSAKATSAGEKPLSPLPIPEPLLRHHRKTLLGPMREWRQKKRMPPVLLLTGLDGAGKRSLAYHLAQWVLCPQSGFGPNAAPDGDPAPCGECPSCLRALSGSWVDFTEIRSEEEGEALKIDQFRKLKSTLGFGAHEGPLRITLIPGADRMTPQAANSLLKLLEEPPPGWAFILTASDPTLVLPTVLSRCQQLRLRPLEEETIRELLLSAGVPKERALLCSRLAQGSWGKAIRLAADEMWEKRSDILAFLSAPSANLNGLVDWATTQPSHFEILVDQLESLLADLMRQSARPTGSDAGSSPAASSWANADGAKELAAHSAQAVAKLGSLSSARDFWAARAERIGRARRESLAPVNRKLLVQDLLLPWLEL